MTGEGLLSTSLALEVLGRADPRQFDLFADTARPRSKSGAIAGSCRAPHETGSVNPRPDLRQEESRKCEECANRHRAFDGSHCCGRPSISLRENPRPIARLLGLRAQPTARQPNLNQERLAALVFGLHPTTKEAAGHQPTESMGGGLKLDNLISRRAAEAIRLDVCRSRTDLRRLSSTLQAPLPAASS